MIFNQIALVLVVAAVFGTIAKYFKQPLIIGYLFAGITLGYLGAIGGESFESLGQIGVALLLFLLGLEMNIRDLASVGRVAIITGVGQIFFTSLFGFILANLMGFTGITAVYIAVALTFSSTIIMVKLLSEKKDLGSLYGRIAIGFLLVQDLFAILILMFLSGVGEHTMTVGGFVFLLVKAIVLITSVWYLSKNIIPRIFEKVSGSSMELMFITSIAWALGLAAFVAGPLGFTLEIGGFLAGIALSNLPEHLQIANKAKPLRDFFLTIFFLILGSQLIVAGGIGPIIIPAIIFSLFVLIGNPIIVLSIMGFLGYKKRTSFLAGLTVAQISEFSLILMAMGAGLGQVSDTSVALVVVVGVITMTLSTYMIMKAENIYKKIAKYLNIFEKRRTKEDAVVVNTDLTDHVVLVGADTTGQNLVRYFKSRKIPFITIDFNPQIFLNLTANNISAIFGDINDEEIQEAAGIEKAKMIISTTSQLFSNLSLLENISHLKPKPISIFTASDRAEAIKLYEARATYVLVPEVVAGDHLRHLLRTYKSSRKRFQKLGKNHFKRVLYQKQRGRV